MVWPFWSGFQSFRGIPCFFALVASKRACPVDLDRIAVAEHIMIDPKGLQTITVHLKGFLRTVDLFITNLKGQLRCDDAEAVTTRSSPLGPMRVRGSWRSAFPMVRRSPGGR